MHYSVFLCKKYCSCHLGIEKAIRMKTHAQNIFNITFKAFKFFFVFKHFPIGLKENLRDEDNLSTMDLPNVSFVQRFYCRHPLPCYSFCTLVSVVHCTSVSTLQHLSAFSTCPRVRPTCSSHTPIVLQQLDHFREFKWIARPTVE